MTEAAPHEARALLQDQGDEIEESLANTFRGKVISVRSMEGWLLVPAMVAIAIIIAAAILIALRELPWPEVGAGFLNPSATLPLPVVVVTTIAMILGWSFVLAGSLHAHLLFRVAGVAIYTAHGLLGALFILLSGASTLSATSVVITISIVLAVPLAAIGLWFSDRANYHQARHLHHGVRIRPVTFLWTTGVTALLYLLTGLSGASKGTFAGYLTAELAALQVLFIPVLLLAGTDFAEWAEVLGGRLSSVSQRAGRGATSFAIVAGVLAMLAFNFWNLGDAKRLELDSLAYSLLPAAAVGIVVGLLVIVASRRRAGVRVPLWALVLGMLLMYVPAMSLSFVALPGAGDPSSEGGSGSLASYQQRGDPSFSLRYPARWESIPSRTGLVLEGHDASGLPVRFVVLHTAAAQYDMAGAVTRVGPASVGAPVTMSAAAPTNGWQRGTVRATLGGVAVEGPAWSRVEGDVRWTLTGLAPATVSTSFGAIFTQIRNSWSPSVPEPARHFDTSRGIIEFGIAGALLVIGGLLVMSLFHGPVVAGGAFLLLSGFSFFLQIALLEAKALFGVADPVSAVSYEQGLGLLALLLLPVILTSRVRHRAHAPLRPLLTLVAGLCVLTVVYSIVFPAALESARFSVLQGCVLLLAMLWDVMMSGESITNRGGRVAPRHSRTLIYLGYIVMVVAAVLFFSSLHGPTEGDAFESELWVQNGIDFLGLPLLLTFFVVNLAAAWLGPSAGNEPVHNRGSAPLPAGRGARRVAGPE